MAGVCVCVPTSLLLQWDAQSGTEGQEGTEMSLKRALTSIPDLAEPAYSSNPPALNSSKLTSHCTETCSKLFLTALLYLHNAARTHSARLTPTQSQSRVWCIYNSMNPLQLYINCTFTSWIYRTPTPSWAQRERNSHITSSHDCHNITELTVILSDFHSYLL